MLRFSFARRRSLLAAATGCLIAAGPPAFAQEAGDAATSPSSADPFGMLKTPEGIERLIDLGLATGEHDFVLGERRVPSATDLADAEVKTLFFRGSYQFAAKNYDKALATFEEALKREPRNATIMLASAEAMHELGDEDRAIAACRRVLQIQEHNVAALLLKSRAEDQAGRRDHAIQSLEKALTLQPNQKEALGDLGALYFKQAQYQKGVEAFERLVALEPGNLRGLLYLCFGHKLGGNLDRSIFYANEAVDYYPQLAQCHELRLDALSAAQRWDEFVEASRFAILRVPEFEPFATQFNTYVLRRAAIEGKLGEYGQTFLNDQAINSALGDLVAEEIPEGSRITPRQRVRLAVGLIPAYEDFRDAHPTAARPRVLLARLYERTGQIDKAVESYVESTDLGGDRAKSYYRAGALRASQGRYDQAESNYQLAHEASPFWSQPYLGLGALKEGVALYGEAATIYGEGLALDPENVELARSLGRARFNSGDVEGAIEALKNALAQTGDDPRLHAELGRAYERAGQFDLAVMNMGRAAERDPASLGFRVELLEMQLAGGLPTASDTLTRIKREFSSLAGSPEHARALGSILLSFGRQEEALDLVDWLLNDRQTGHESAVQVLLEAARVARGPRQVAEAKQRMETVALRFASLAARNQTRGALLGALGEHDAAIVCFRRAVEQGWGDTVAVMGQLAELHLKKGEFDKAAALYDEAVGSLGAQKAAPLLPLKVQALMKGGRKADAVAAASEFAAGEGASAYYSALGSAFQQSGELEEAERYYRASLERDPADATALNNLGYMFAERGNRLEEAQSLIEQALSLNPGAAYILDSLGWAHFQRGDYQRAADLMEASVAVGAEPDPVVLGHLGDAYDRLGARPMAERYWRQAHHLDPDNAEFARKIGRVAE
jgi:tetratricopeptide (TPR) repeat protein